MTLRIRNLEMLAKVEATYGVDPTLTGAADAVLAENVVIGYPGDIIDRVGVAGSLSPQAPQLARNHTSLTFDVEFKGSGTDDTPPDWSPLLQACGFSETVNAPTDVTWDPISDTADFKSATLEYYLDGLLFQVLGGRGNVSFNFTVGQRAMMSYAFLGKYVAPTDVALPGGTYQTTVPPPLKNVGLQVGAFTPVLASWTIDMQNQVDPGDDLNSADGYAPIEILGRDPLGTIDPETTLVAGNNWWADWQAGTERAIDITVGTVAGNILKVTAPKCVHRDISMGDRNGRSVLTIPHTLGRDTAAGDDEIQIIQTDV